MVQSSQNLKKLSIKEGYMLNIKLEKVDNWFEEKEILSKILLEALYECGAIKTWYRDRPEGWVLNSKLWSPVYISLREISSKQNAAFLLELIGKSLSKLIINEIPNFNKILGLATTGIQIITAITIYSNIPSLYTRKLENNNDFENFDLILKKYGEHNLIEGEMKDNDIIIIVDDLVTKFNSAVFGRKQLYYEANKRNCNVICDNAVVLIDREQGAELIAKTENMKLHSLIKFKSNLHWLKDKLAPIEYQILNEYFKDYLKFQNNDEIKDIISLAK